LDAQKSRGRSTPIFLILFFVSGISALIYEIVWTRLFTVVIGNTVFSVSVILMVFMAGLALGSRVAGRTIDRNPVPLIRSYAVLEAAIGLYNLALPWLLKLADPIFRFAYSSGYQSPPVLACARLAICGFLLIVPATLMGATLPVLVRYYTEKVANAGRQAGRVYSVNTLGAALGAAAAGFLLIPFIGVTSTLGAAALLNLSIAAAAWLISRRHEVYSEALTELPEPPAEGRRIVLLAAFFSGAAALINEVGWTRVLSLVLGPTTYAFTLMLCAMITGLGLGAALGSYWVRRSIIRLTTLAWAQGCIAFASVALIPVFGRLPLFIGKLVIRHADSFSSLQMLEFLLIFGLMLVPTTILGMTFPMASRLHARSDSLVGTEVSAVYSVNTAGGIVGSLIAGFALIPAFGSQTALMVAALTSAAAAAALAISSRRWLPLALTLVVAPAVLVIPKWSPELMASGAYKYAPYAAKLDLESVLRGGTLLYFKEGITTTVSAKKYRGRVSLSVDGKVDATDAGDMLTQKMLAHLPLLLRNDSKNVAIIGLGSGVTAAAVLAHPVERLDIIEISPEVVEASRFFSHVNHNALMDRRTELIIGDGRNHLRYIPRNYDVIISEPSNPWMAGMASLFTREFFNEARSRLSSAGTFCQWLHSYNMSTDDLRTIIRTFMTAFPNASLWTLNENDFILLGSAAPLTVDENRIQRNFERVASDLQTVHVQDVYSIASLLMLSNEELDRFAQGATLNTDDMPILEFRAPRFVYSDTAGENLAALSRFSLTRGYPATTESRRHKAEMYLAAEAFGEARAEFIHVLRENPRDQHAWKGIVETARSGFDRPALRSFLEEALKTEPTIVARLAAGEFYFQEGNYSRVVEILSAVLQEQPSHIEALERIADATAHQGGAHLAEIAARMLSLEPENPKALYHLATVRLYQGRSDESIQLVKHSLAIDPNNVSARNLLAIAYGQTFQPQLAEAEFRRAIEQAPDDSTTYNNYGIFLMDRERLAEARRQFQNAIGVNPEDAEAFAGMGETFRHEGNLAQAQQWYRRALKVNPNQPVAKTYVK
jgi:spermidine synthase